MAPELRRFRYYRGVRFVAPWRPAPKGFTRCGTCGRAWDDDKSTAITPAPSARCPFEAFRGHNAKPRRGADEIAADEAEHRSETRAWLGAEARR